MAVEFALELTRSPARVAERKELFTGPDYARYRAKTWRFAVIATRPSTSRVSARAIFGAVDDKAELLLHRPAGKYPWFSRNPETFLSGLLQQARDRTLADRSG